MLIWRQIYTCWQVSRNMPNRGAMACSQLHANKSAAMLPMHMIDTHMMIHCYFYAAQGAFLNIQVLSVGMIIVMTAVRYSPPCLMTSLSTDMQNPRAGIPQECANLLAVRRATSALKLHGATAV